ncbi:transmembrane and coiled-coil domain protein 3 isoform X2 [Clupea harengus]|uniref:Transmembrane and coiled-coil domain protein 3 isoform X2 n=1 Tax=Clupea harengus TaxID=7950 RepID=A0A6P8GGS2_CLUHA|nr:transmembrane and coiled-coil domain protein 3 isoform X2 [Clupea harengus]XP_031438348.1 transmembrane and coiled-coil domain protein 3 isoform X2 [Clupea harengus]XP_031438349.1 transmembrane and coiled-coil domain protein 3 isoform X2 [Clupea harengus]XP_042565934.1 transmembrane and coiled-coil domain protein 3 isoform X2 [Clupea harengus]
MRRLTLSSLFVRRGSEADHSSESSLLNVPALLKRGVSETDLDSDGPGRDSGRARTGLDSLQQKILKVTEQLKIEQTSRDENVAEYLKLVNSADKQQMGRIRQVFEKKNQKSAQSITQLQKKLEQYHHRRMRENENGAKHSSSSSSSSTVAANANTKDGSSKTASKDSLKECLKDAPPREVKHPSLDKVKTVGPGSSPFFFSKPREFANLIRNKFGSADNIAHLKSSMETGSGVAGGAFQVGVGVGEGGAAGRTLSGSATITPKPKYPPSDDECSTGTTDSVDSTGAGGGGTGSQGTGDGVGAAAGGAGVHGAQNNDNTYRLVEAMQEVREIRKTQLQLADDMEALKTQFKRDYGFITQTLQEERYRYERLEDQLNDLTELHQNETANLKQELASIEEKVAYQAYERARDIQEVLEACQTRVSKLELQQQQQQIIQLEGADAKVLLGKCINIMLAIATVILVCVSTAAKFTAPLLRSRLHVFGTFLSVCLLAVIWKNWDHVQFAVERMILPN